MTGVRWLERICTVLEERVYLFNLFEGPQHAFIHLVSVYITSMSGALFALSIACIGETLPLIQDGNLDQPCFIICEQSFEQTLNKEIPRNQESAYLLFYLLPCTDEKYVNIYVMHLRVVL